TFPVFARASFGTMGTHLASVLRGIVGCGWFGIQTWIGGIAIYECARAQWPTLAETPVLGLISNAQVQVNAAQFICFLIFWLLNIGIFWKGMESIRWVENWGAPLLIAMGLALLGWAWWEADGFGPMLSQPAKFATAGEFWAFFFPSLTAMVGFWATLSLNIPDFTREAKSQKAQMLGQFLGLNTTMPFYAFIGVAVTSATVVIFGETIWDPVQLLSRFGSFWLLLLSMFALMLATLTTNLAANVLAPASAFSNFLPKAISLRIGGLITGVIGILMMPWKLVADPSGYIFTWLIGYSALLGPIGGILVADYFLVRKTRLDLPALYQPQGAYSYHSGINPAAVIALGVAVLPNLPGFLGQIGVMEVSSFWKNLYHYAWFTGFLVAMGLYRLLMGRGNAEKV
ncbi:MAG: NCS1 family nucleobase:cation symporter-1, partial [Candidatus Methylacidiphilales bacterium]